MSLNTKTLETIRLLRTEAHKLATFHEVFASKYASDSSCDKKGFGFGKDNRFAAFSVSTSFDSWSGYYGNSSCGRVFSLNQEAARFITQAMNVHQKEIFATAARLMREEAATLTTAAAEELAALQQMLTVAQTDAPADDKAA
jgi:hypothetical protein